MTTVRFGVHRQKRRARTPRPDTASDALAT